MAKVEVDLELANIRCVEVTEREKKEKRRVAELEKAMEELKGK